MSGKPLRLGHQGEDVTIRPLMPADAPAARALILEGLAEHWGTLDARLNSDLDDIPASYASGLFLVAEIGGALAGTGALIPEEPGVGRIVRMSVAREKRRQGIGRLLLAALLAAARERGYQRIVLETTATWEDAIAFYRRAGFGPVGERDGDLHFVLELGAETSGGDEP
ncbi:MAG: GNAT family N-acetyltransferase [Anaerolineae bacterium]|nr:GNAT family N-acetyltransferase [Anaerolineae bacterium]